MLWYSLPIRGNQASNKILQYLPIVFFDQQHHLVGGLELCFIFSILYWNNNPNWLIFFRGLKPPTSHEMKSSNKKIFHLKIINEINFFQSNLQTKSFGDLSQYQINSNNILSNQIEFFQSHLKIASSLKSWNKITGVPLLWRARQKVAAGEPALAFCFRHCCCCGIFLRGAGERFQRWPELCFFWIHLRFNSEFWFCQWLSSLWRVIGGVESYQ